MSQSDVPFPADPNPRKPKFSVPPESWDCHFHIFGPPDRFPYDAKRLFTPPASPIEHWLKTSAAVGIGRGVLVTPGTHDTNPAVTLDAIARSEGRVCGFIRADATLTVDKLKELHRGGIRGMRFPFAQAVKRAFDVEAFKANIALMEAVDWIAEFHIDGDALERHAAMIGDVDLPIIIDQFAGARPGAGLDQPIFRTLLDLLKRPNVYVKLMCADRQLAVGERYEDIVALSRALIATAPERVIWGTDWPHAYVYEANAVPNDGDLVNMLLDFAPDETTRNRILVHNPAGLFNL